MEAGSYSLGLGKGVSSGRDRSPGILAMREGFTQKGGEESMWEEQEAAQGKSSEVRDCGDLGD